MSAILNGSLKKSSFSGFNSIYVWVDKFRIWDAIKREEKDIQLREELKKNKCSVEQVIEVSVKYKTAKQTKATASSSSKNK